MKFYLFCVLLCIPLYTSAQANYCNFCKDGEGFDSHFQKMKEGTFRGKVNGILLLKDVQGDRAFHAFSEDTARLAIVPDPNEIYDVSFKKYLAENNHVQLKYRTYGYANALALTIDKKKYELSLIDGGMDQVINGLDYRYVPTEESEFLIIYFTRNVGLSSKRRPTDPDLFIQQGSTLGRSDIQLVFF